MHDDARILAIETVGEACSVALFDREADQLCLTAYDHRILGRGHAEALIPMIAALPDRGRAGRICVSLGPGSFTGVRIGIATARALGVAWGAEVLGFPTLALVAAMALNESGAAGVCVCMNGGHGEWFVQNFSEREPRGAAKSLRPDAAAEVCEHELVAGNRAGELILLGGAGKRAIATLPDARAFPLLPAEALTPSLSPIYGRAPDARPRPTGPRTDADE